MRLRTYELSTLGVTAECDLQPDLPLVQGDPRQLQQVLLNLVVNAAQAMEAGGGTLRIVSRAERDGVVVEVSDAGAGIPPEVRPHVFEPFFTTKRQGTGLGLSVSYGIVAAHGGRISVARTGPEGTTFRVVLPGMGEDAEPEIAARSAPEQAPDSPLAGIQMLFVDDELALHHGIRQYARRRGFDVVTVSDGAAALDAARRLRFDVVVCDLRMRGIDGPAFFEVLRREHPTLAARTLFITGDLVSAGSRAFLDAAGQPVLPKPFDLDRLERSVAALLGDDMPLASQAPAPVA
jgi:CheY-like chemotaxis protein